MNKDVILKLDKMIELSTKYNNICIDEQDFLNFKKYLTGYISSIKPEEILIDSLYGYFTSGAKFWVPNNSLCENPSDKRIYDTYPGVVLVSNKIVKQFKEIDDWLDICIDLSICKKLN
jgi:hypothetical protein